MNYFMELKKMIEEHTSSVPPKGFEITYLEESEELLKLYSEALIIGENDDNVEYDKKIKQLYEKALKVVK